MRLLVTLGAFALLGCASMAGPALITPTSPAPTQAVADTPFNAPAGAYALDSRHTSVLWRVRHQGFSMFTGRFDRSEGELVFDPAAPANSTLTASVDVASVSTGLRDSDGKLSFDGEIAKILGMERNPKITFVSKKITRTGEKTALIDGELTLNGRTKAEELQATFEGYARTNTLSAKPRFGFSGRGLIKRSDFGASDVVFSLFAGDEVEIIIEAEFEKDQA